MSSPKRGAAFPPRNTTPSPSTARRIFDAETGVCESPGEPDFSAAFGGAAASGRKDERICAVTAAMADGCGLQQFKRACPARFFDVGIAEQHAVTFSAALSAGGYLPVFAVYSTFLQRAYDQVLHDAALSGTKLVLGVDRAGIVGGDGETHQGLFDVPLLCGIPGVTVLCPASFDELRTALEQALYQYEGVVAVLSARRRTGLFRGVDRMHEPVSVLREPAGKTLALVSYGRRRRTRSTRARCFRNTARRFSSSTASRRCRTACTACCGNTAMSWLSKSPCARAGWASVSPRCFRTRRLL